jgi:hypothetical protein
MILYKNTRLLPKHGTGMEHHKRSGDCTCSTHQGEGLPDNDHRSAEKEAYLTIKDFTKAMYSRLGVRLFILSAYVDPKESVVISEYIFFSI